MRALVFGADGFLGANLCLELQSQGYDVVGTSLNRKGETSLDALGVKCRIEFGDVTDLSFVERVISSSECDVVFHLAAVSIVRVAEKAPMLALKTNIMGTLNVVDTCHKMGIKCLIASSDKAYGDHDGLPYTETMSLRPRGVYETSKTCADHIGTLYNAIVVRCANLYGPGDLNWSRMIPRSIKLALSGESPKIYGDSVDQKREWIYVKDACKAYIALAKNVQEGAYNVGSGIQMSPMEIGFKIAEMIGSPLPDIENKATPFYEILTQKLDCKKISHLWQHEVSMTTGLQKTVDWYREYLK
jgi:CDP-glucose 4,6-dehydratase